MPGEDGTDPLASEPSHVRACFDRSAPNMGQQHYSRSCQDSWIDRWFSIKDIETGSKKFSCFKCIDKCVFVNDWTA